MATCIDSHMLGCWPLGELSYIYPPFLSKGNHFLYDFASQSSGGRPMPADGVAGW